MLWLLFRLNSSDGTDESSLGLGWPLSLPPPEADLRPPRGWAAAAATTTTSSLYPLGWRGGVGGSSDEVFLGRAVGDDEGERWWAEAAEAKVRLVVVVVG